MIFIVPQSVNQVETLELTQGTEKPSNLSNILCKYPGYCLVYWQLSAELGLVGQDCERRFLTPGRKYWIVSIHCA